MKPLFSLLITCLFIQGVSCAAQISPSGAISDRNTLVNGNNAFAIDLYGQLRRQDGNLFFSPESISTALAMTYAGASGDTASQMAKTLHFTLPPERFHPAMGALLTDLNAPHERYQLHAANALWAQEGYTFHDNFLQLTKTNYGAGFNQVDFKGAAENARQTINKWVEDKTENKIKDLIQPGSLAPSTKLVLTNAIYFKGTWSSQFLKNGTEDEDFHLNNSQSIKTPLMHRSGTNSYLNGGSFQALELPYEGNDLSMVVFLPNDIEGLPAFEKSLTATSMQQWLSQLQPVAKVILTLPKFTMTQQFALQDMLSSMGMPLAFTANADFSAMTPSRGFFISAVIHKTFINVNESGTEAAAATAVGMVGMAKHRPDPTPPTIFRVDHPFLYIIRDNRSGGILFMGRIINPSK